MNMSRHVIEDPGAPGTQDVRFAVSVVNDVETGRRLIAHDVVTPAQPSVLRIGAKPVVHQARTAGPCGHPPRT